MWFTEGQQDVMMDLLQGVAQYTFRIIGEARLKHSPSTITTGIRPTVTASYMPPDFLASSRSHYSIPTYDTPIDDLRRALQGRLVLC
ncbi:hypothetical protein T265_08153 [Opisthorchis viverrini]|uniref:Uncharacterized protein n=1 Tax=Opisthorchis viverrini TaxID=6198 RepID=A0A074ZA28_OPIVI|nr:hypothetical protein T265_08153 [Opisthorchis viverrini]KER24111.1 hypothetical protein T265_08153 [Opisthorchis viverrini]